MAPVNKRTRTAQESSRPTHPALSYVWRILGTAAVTLALAISLLLSAKHIWALSVVGCGSGGGCEWTLNGPYSRFLAVAIAYWGVGAFAALLLLWLSQPAQERSGLLTGATRAGAILSLAFVGLMLFTGHICPWCLAVHGANLLFWLVVERTRRAAAAPAPRAIWKPLSAVLLAGLLIASCQGLEWREQLQVQAVQHEAALRSLAAMQMEQPQSIPPELPEAPSETAVTPATRRESEAVKSESNRFGGRYWLGSRQPKVRVVLFHDYQCELCFQVEDIIKGLLAERTDLAVSVKQWPFDSTCNRFILGGNPHPGACLASRAAEAVGLMGGDSAFWKMHYWLVGRGGNIDGPSLDQQVRLLGLDPLKFREVLNGQAVDSILEADISEGMTFGLKWTPMVFVNGYQVQGWNSPGALPAAIDRAAALAAANPRTLDRPESAVNLQVRAWQQEPIRDIPISNSDHVRGDPQAGVTLVAFGDLTCPFNAAFFRILDEALQRNRSVKVIFKDFPLDGQCNDLVQREINPFGCYAARVAQGAGLLGGDRAYSQACQWLLDHRASITSNSTADIASVLGLEASSLEAAAAGPEVQQRLAANVTLAKQLGVDTSPTIYVSGRRVAGWQTPGLLEQVLRLAQRSQQR